MRALAEYAAAASLIAFCAGVPIVIFLIGTSR